MCSKLTIKTPDRSKLGIDFTPLFRVFIVDLVKLSSGFFEVLLLLILNRYFLILVVEVEQVNVEKVFITAANPIQQE